MREILSILAGILVVIGDIPYIVSILRKEKPNKPSKASWIIWAILDTIAFAGMVAEDSVNGQIIGTVLGVWVVMALALIYGKPGFTKLEKFCLIGAVFGLILWKIIGPVAGVVTSLILIFIGSLPTFDKARKNPGGEDGLSWIIWWLSSLVQLIALQKWDLAHAAQPVVFITSSTIMLCLIYIIPRKKFYKDDEGFIRFSVTSDNTTGPSWVKELDTTERAANFLVSTKFERTDGITSEVVVIPYDLFPENAALYTSMIRSAAESRKFLKPRPEIACLIRRFLSNQDILDMELFSIVVMHEPIDDTAEFFADCFLLGAIAVDGLEDLRLDVYDDGEGFNYRWTRGIRVGFAFVTSERRMS